MSSSNIGSSKGGGEDKKDDKKDDKNDDKKDDKNNDKKDDKKTHPTVHPQPFLMVPKSEHKLPNQKPTPHGGPPAAVGVLTGPANQAQDALNVVSSAKKTKSALKLEAAKEAEIQALKKYEEKIIQEKAKLEAKSKRLAEEEARRKYEAEIAAAERRKQADLAEAKRKLEGKNQYELDAPDVLAKLKKKTSMVHMSRSSSRESVAEAQSKIRKTLANVKVLEKIKSKSSLRRSDGNTKWKKPKKKSSKFKGPDDDDRGSTHELHKYSKFVFGPNTHSINYQWFAKRLTKIQRVLICLSVAVSFIMGMLLFVKYILPKQLFSYYIIEDIMGMGASLYFIPFGGWFYCAVAYLALLYAVALIQFARPENWGKVGELRWLVLVFIELYMCCCFFNYAVNLYRFQLEVHNTMTQDIESGGVKLQSIQKYLECCGVDTLKDWEKVLKKNPKIEKDWHGELCTGDDPEISIQNICYKNERKEIQFLCKTPPSCWETVEVPFNDTNSCWYQSTFKQSCHHAEMIIFYSVLGVFNVLVLAIIIATSVTFWYIRRVVNLANKKGVELRPKLQFEQCL